ncbi:TIGR01620 family protein [Microbulbifer sp. 2205BS26-8]|uniref:TIGR01620 family protein n=1 Tax=Microbulbifer sp. 2205BS26-8 TaxID=3064386 RepID=UPI00273E7220|nr:TIGR01620 family protein [Microbulbifer sp. 2205BS26-8]MDP5209963.1 TIGR01620 family protein [Microbulbifer sp. 2205BS26-8]
MTNGDNKAPQRCTTRIEPLEELGVEAPQRDTTRVEALIGESEEIPRSITTGESLPDRIAFSELRLPSFHLRWLRPASLSTAGLVLAVLAWELRQLYTWAVDKHWALGVLTALVIVAFAFTIVSSVWEFFRAGQPLRKLEKTRVMAAQMRDCRSHEEAETFRCQLQEYFVGKPQGALLDRVLDEAPDYYDSSELLQYLETAFLHALDQEALRRVVRHSTTTGTLVGLSPFASIDILVALRQALRMIDDVAQIYGIRPSMVVRWRLFKKVLALVAYSGASEYAISELWPELVGDSVLSTISVRLGQGVGASLFVARIGLATLQGCRPIPFAGKQGPRLGEVIGNIGAGLKERMPGVFSAVARGRYGTQPVTPGTCQSTQDRP